MKTLFVAALFVLSLSVASGQITYVEATPTNTTLADGTALNLTGSPVNPQDYTSSGSGATANNHWHLRTGFANGSDVWASAPGSDSPALRTTITGLTPGSTYQVHTYYWVAGDGAPTGNNQWDLGTGLTAATITPYLWNAGTKVDGVVGYFDGSVLTTEGNRRLFAIDLGTVVADGSGASAIYIDDFPGNDDRTWYDGVGYELVGPSETYVDATAANTTLEDGTALNLVVSSPVNPQDYTTNTTGATANDHWNLRTGLANNSDVWTSHPGSDSPALRTTIDGLTAGESYIICVHYWVSGNGNPSGNQQWDVAAGFTAPATSYFWNGGEQVTDTSVFATPPLVSEGDRRLFAVEIGSLVADGAGEIQVVVNDFPGNDDRTWYDGISWRPGVIEPPVEPDGVVEIAPNGAWTWFNDERSIFHQGYLFSGYVLSDGRYGVTRYDPATDTASHMIISTAASQQQDDHNNPSLTALPDGRLLAVYSKHGGARFYYRISHVTAPSASADWGAEQIRTLPNANSYSNTYRLTAESDTIYNFHRCIDWNPCVSISTDDGATWADTIHFIKAGVGGVRPYTRYCSNNADRVDLIYTDGHPRDINNSIYHMYYQGGNFRHTDGTLVKAFADLPIDHDAGERGTVVYPYSSAAWGAGDGPDDWIPGGRAWTWDVDCGVGARPACVFQVQRDNVTGIGWNHDRIYYYYARWTGTAWQRRFIAHGGRGLYASEDDYGGGMAIDPEDPRIVYISTNAADPFALGDIDNVPLAADSRYEIWRGFTADGGLSFTWDPVTRDSAADNLRPIVPAGHGRTRHVVWFQGAYVSYTSFSTRVMGAFGETADTYADWAGGYGLGAGSYADDADRDGLANGLEYGLGGDPTDPSDRPAPVWAGGGLNFRVQPANTDIEWVVQSSEDLVHWSTAAVLRAADLPATEMPGFLIEFDPDDPDQVVVKPTAVPVPDRRFLRVGVAHR